MRAEPVAASRPAPIPGPSPRRHREMLAIAVGVAALAAVLEIRDDQRVAVRGWPAYPLPELCSARAWFGVACPGCGLTRGLIRLAHADWTGAMAVHRLSGLMACAILVQIPYRIACLRTGRPPLGRRAPRAFAWFLVGALLINWAVTIADPAQGGPAPGPAPPEGPRAISRR